MQTEQQRSANFLCLTSTDRNQPEWRRGHELNKVKAHGLAAFDKLHKYKAGWGRMGKREVGGYVIYKHIKRQRTRKRRPL